MMAAAGGSWKSGGFVAAGTSSPAQQGIQNKLTVLNLEGAQLRRQQANLRAQGYTGFSAGLKIAQNTRQIANLRNAYERAS